MDILLSGGCGKSNKSELLTWMSGFVWVVQVETSQGLELETSGSNTRARKIFSFLIMIQRTAL